MWPLYSGINRSFSKMMEAAGSAISKKMTKSFALDQAPLVEVADDERQGLVTKTHFTLGIAVGWDCSPGNLLKNLVAKIM